SKKHTGQVQLSSTWEFSGSFLAHHYIMSSLWMRLLQLVSCVQKVYYFPLYSALSSVFLFSSFILSPSLNSVGIITTTLLFIYHYSNLFSYSIFMLY
ncbi:hypothetical protein L9F63_000593, partial [Diploptera punctata]